MRCGVGGVSVKFASEKIKMLIVLLDCIIHTIIDLGEVIGVLKQNAHVIFPWQKIFWGLKQRYRRFLENFKMCFF